MNIKKILSIFICLAALLSLNSCEDDGPRGGGGDSKQYVFTPYSIMVDILDEQGRSRLSPQHPQNLLDKNITATIRDKHTPSASLTHTLTTTPPTSPEANPTRVIQTPTSKTATPFRPYSTGST